MSGLYTDPNFIKTLRDLMVGQTVVAVDEPGNDGDVADFTMADGTKFRLSASELGASIEMLNAPGKDE